MELEFAPSFQRELKKKPRVMKAAIVTTVARLADNRYHPGLHAHRVQGTADVYEAYVDGSNRLTFHYEGGRMVFRRHCNHDILK